MVGVGGERGEECMDLLLDGYDSNTTSTAADNDDAI